MTLEIADIATPIGRLRLAARRGVLCALDFAEHWPRDRARLEKRFGRVEFRRSRDPGGVVGRLRAYFAGDLRALRGVRVDPGGTPFQRRVWSALRRVTPGRTIAYRDLARTIGAPAAARAVGAANGANPIGIVIPCHRVVTAGGALGGYAWGIERKRWLLQHESSMAH
jgi:methylated-DNA-[protein]-cysteine S-methyltransferase